MSEEQSADSAPRVKQHPESEATCAFVLQIEREGQIPSLLL